MVSENEALAPPGLAPGRRIPLWIRALAAVFVLVAGYAAVLLVRDGSGVLPQGAALLLLVASITLGVCLTALFAYVAVTGAPPTHLWPAAGDSCFSPRTPLRLDPAISAWLGALRDRHAGLAELWLLRPDHRAVLVRGEMCRLLAVGDAAALEALRADWDIRRRDVRLFLVDAATGAISTAWGRPWDGRLVQWIWGEAADPGERAVPSALANDLDDQAPGLRGLRVW